MLRKDKWKSQTVLVKIVPVLVINYDAKLPGYISMISELYLYLSLFSMSLVLFLSLCGNGRSFVLSVIDSVVHSAELK